jgi:hypothetical protein
MLAFPRLPPVMAIVPNHSCMKNIIGIASLALSLPFAANPAEPIAHFEVAQRGQDYALWHRVNYVTNQAGRTVACTNTYKALETGKHYWANGQWLESREEIHIVPGGALATNTPHKVSFSANIKSPVSVAVTTPAGKTLKIRPLGLAYFDFHSEDQVLIAELKDSIGQLITTNQVCYSDAFSNVLTDVRYAVRKSGIEQDVVLRQRPPLPEDYGMNPTTTWLLMLTEFIDPPSDVQVVQELRRGWTQSTVDRLIKIAGMHIGQGTAFSLGLGQDRRAGVPVQKHWEVMEGRTFLIEEVPFPRIVRHLRNLQAATTPPGSRPPRRLASKDLTLPPVLAGDATASRSIQLASTRPINQGLVLDFPLESAGDVLLKADETYLVTGTVNLTNLVIEGGTVVKYNTNSSINVIGPIQCLTGPYRPATFTAIDDDSIGTSMSTGPLNGTYADCALSLSQSNVLAYLNIRYANAAIYCINGDCSLTHSQFISCGVGLHCEHATFGNYNQLMCRVGYAYYGSHFNGVIQHLTCDQADSLIEDWDYSYDPDCHGGMPSSSITLINSLTTGLLNGYGGDLVGHDDVPITLDHVRDFSTGNGVFQTVGAGAYYLVDGSTNRDAGTPTINGGNLYQTTTYPPIVYSNVLISTDTEFGPQAQRDIDTPDLGFHYPSADVACKYLWVTNATLRLKPGTTLATFGPYGIGLLSGSRIVSEGTPTSPNRITRYNTVQECSTTNWNLRGDSIHGTWYGAASAQAHFRFTDWSMPAQEGRHFSIPLGYTTVISFSDCEFRGGSLLFQAPAVAFTNCLFERSEGYIEGAFGGLSPTFQNCLFWAGSLYLNNADDATWTFRDNLFDRTLISQEANNLDAAYNGYTPGTNRLRPTNGNDVVASVIYQSGPLGSYYQPTDSAFLNKGSTNANLLGLYHYTTQIDQTKETNTVVDIGYHYVAAESAGNPLDADGDGVPDYLEDYNGNGAVNSGETDWQDPSDLGLKVLITTPKRNSTLP